MLWQVQVASPQKKMPEQACSGGRLFRFHRVLRPDAAQTEMSPSQRAFFSSDFVAAAFEVQQLCVAIGAFSRCLFFNP